MNEDVKKYFIYFVVLLFLLYVGYSTWSNLHSRQPGDTEVTSKLQSLERDQQRLTIIIDGLAKDLATSQQRVSRIEGRIDAASTGVSHVTSNLADSQKSLAESAGIIAENQRILSDIFKRNEQQGKLTPQR